MLTLYYRILTRQVLLILKLLAKRLSKRNSRNVYGKRQISQTHSLIGQRRARTFYQIGSVRYLANFPLLQEHQSKTKCLVAKRGALSLPLVITILNAAKLSCLNLQGREVEFD